MNILLTVGFFGSGKTTVLSKLTARFLEREKRICIVENEIGAYAIDDLLLKHSGVQMTTIKGGCVCCQITGSLIGALRTMKREMQPDWVLVELTGTAFADTLAEQIQMYLPGDFRLVVMSVTDAARWPSLMKAARPMIERQLQGCRVAVVNKADMAKSLDAVLNEVRQMLPQAMVLPMTATRSDCSDLADILEREMNICG